MTIWAYRAHRFGNRPDQPIINGADIEASAQPHRLGGYYIRRTVSRCTPQCAAIVRYPDAGNPPPQATPAALP